MCDIYTRNFINFKHNKIVPSDYTGNRAILSSNYKLVIRGTSTDQTIELFDIHQDSAEEHNIAEENPDVVSNLQKTMKQWQDSVLNSLTGADYK